MPSDSDSLSDTAGITAALFSFFLFFLAVGGVRFVSWLGQKFWNLFPTDPTHPAVVISISFLCILMGKILFVVREARLDIYAYLELGSAFGVAAEGWTKNIAGRHSTGAAFALLGAIYIAVRGFDNLKKAQKE